MDVSKWFNQTIIYNKYNGINGDGTENYSANKNISARCELKLKNIYNQSGKIVTANGTIMTVEDIKPHDQIQYNGITYNILNISQIIDKSGNRVYTEGVFI